MFAGAPSPDRGDHRRAALRDSLLESSGGSPLVTVTQLAGVLNVRPAWVYEHQAEYGAIRLGDGPRPPIRFHVDAVADALVPVTQQSPGVAAVVRSRREDLLPLNDRVRAALPRREVA